MISAKGIVLDANILLGAVFGQRIRSLNDKYGDSAGFFSPDSCLDEAKKYVPEIAARRGIDVDFALVILDGVSATIEFVDRELYSEFSEEAHQRIGSRDPDDWPVIATALMLGLPIWTDDQDFFGTGIATWTTASVELFLKN